VVSATVRPVARIESAAPPSRLVLDAGDLARGYVDVVAGGRWVLRTNAGRYTIELAIPDDGSIVAVEVRGLGSTETVVGPRARIERQTTGAGRIVLEPTWRLHLGDGARPGAGSWPIELSVRTP